MKAALEEFRVERNGHPVTEGRRRCTVYPFDRMAIGDSFRLHGRSQRNRCHAAMINYSRRHPGYAFIIRPLSLDRSEQYRCWRVGRKVIA